MLAAPPHRSVGPRIAMLCSQLEDPQRVKSAIAELAMLASCSETARRAMHMNQVETRIVQLLSAQGVEPQLQAWGLSVLSNLAVGRGTSAIGKEACNRHLSSLPVLSSLIASKNPEVQHAAALHMATLSHSHEIRNAIAKARSEPLASLYALEDPAASTKEQLPSPYARRLRDEALDYARLALRTSQGRNYKPAFDPKAFFAQKASEKMGATCLQASTRRHQAQKRYRHLQHTRSTKAVVVQKHVRGMQAREHTRCMRADYDRAASVIGARLRGCAFRRKMRPMPTIAEEGERDVVQEEEMPVRIIGLRLDNAEEKFMMLPIRIYSAPDPPQAVSLSLSIVQGVSLQLQIGVQGEAPPVRNPRVCSPRVRSPRMRSPRMRSPRMRSPGVRSPRVRSPTILKTRESEAEIAEVSNHIAKSAIAAAIEEVAKEQLAVSNATAVKSPDSQVLKAIIARDPSCEVAHVCARKAVAMGIQKALAVEPDITSCSAREDQIMFAARESDMASVERADGAAMHLQNRYGVCAERAVRDVEMVSHKAAVDPFTVGDGKDATSEGNAASMDITSHNTTVDPFMFT